MKKYISPQFERLRLFSTDIITSSGDPYGMAEDWSSIINNLRGSASGVDAINDIDSFN